MHLVSSLVVQAREIFSVWLCVPSGREEAPAALWPGSLIMGLSHQFDPQLTHSSIFKSVVACDLSQYTV